MAPTVPMGATSAAAPIEAGGSYSVALASSQPCGRASASVGGAAGAGSSGAATGAGGGAGTRWRSPLCSNFALRQAPKPSAWRLQSRIDGPARIPPATSRVAHATPMVSDTDAAARDPAKACFPLRASVEYLEFYANSGVLRAGG